MTVIHWFRRDLRLADNTALNAALASGEQVVPVFVFDPTILRSPYAGTPRLAFMLNGLRALDLALGKWGGRLLLRHGDPETVLPQIVRELNARAVYVNRDYSPYARQREGAVGRALHVPLRAYDDVVLRAPGSVLKDDGAPYIVYTPFMRRWREQVPPPRPETVVPSRDAFHTLKGVTNPGLPRLEDLRRASTIAVPEASEEAARRRLAAFVAGPIYAYDDLRDRLVIDPFSTSPPEGPSYLSPYLRCGMLSPRQAYWAAQAARAETPDTKARTAVNTWVNELIWREFYVHILYHFPHVLRASFRAEYEALPWRDAPGDLQAWKDGRTGYPVVDAAMRQLAQIGWMPNRARMIVASFLTKDLLVNWRAGETHFMQWLIDGDPAANNGGWQWAAGTGTDAQPYFRIFNPVSQSERYDPHGTYIRHWLPELRAVPSKHIHAPWLMDPPPSNYPSPIVDHRVARERALAAFKSTKG